MSQQQTNALVVADAILNGKDTIDTKWGKKNKVGIADMLCEFADNNGPELTEDDGEFMVYLNLVLIPDLMKSGSKETAKDFMKAVKIINRLTK